MYRSSLINILHLLSNALDLEDAEPFRERVEVAIHGFQKHKHLGGLSDTCPS